MVRVGRLDGAAEKFGPVGQYGGRNAAATAVAIFPYRYGGIIAVGNAGFAIHVVKQGGDSGGEVRFSLRLSV